MRILSAVTAALLVYDRSRRLLGQKDKREWVSDLYKTRTSEGFRTTILPKLLSSSKNLLKKFLRVNERELKILLAKLRPRLEKKYYVRAPITAEERLMVTLR